MLHEAGLTQDGWHHIYQVGPIRIIDGVSARKT